jgi:hypothetical protein
LSPVLGAIIVVVCLIGLRLHGCLSLVGAFLLGCTAYSLPAVIGVYLPPLNDGSGGFAEVSPEAQLAIGFAWAAIGASLLIGAMPGPEPHGAIEDRALVAERVRTFRTLCLIASGVLYLWIAIGDSPLYFLRPREAAGLGMAEQKLLWRWVNTFGLVASVWLRSRPSIAIFAALMVIYFIAGDRTMLLIASTAVIVHQSQRRSAWRLVGRWQFMLGIGVIAVLLWAGKPIYVAIKLQSWAPIDTLSDDRYQMTQWASFEPLLVHAMLEDVIKSGFAYPIGQVVMGSVGQLLILPSAFDIDSSAFNIAFTTAHYEGITYGLAFNYWAEAYSIGGLPGVVLFAALLTFAVCFLDRWSARAGALERIVIITAGTVLAVYVYRNSLENALAFIRQVMLVGLPLLVMTHVLVPNRRVVARLA